MSKKSKLKFKILLLENEKKALRKRISALEKDIDTIIDYVDNPLAYQQDVERIKLERAFSKSSQEEFDKLIVFGKTTPKPYNNPTDE